MMGALRKVLLAASLGLLGLAPLAVADTGLVIKLQDAIGPATAEHFLDGLERAQDEGHTLVILELDTPGGLDASMRDMIQGILASPVPVVTWVAPPGARAASAGTYLLYASHVAAMAPGTNLGAATPVAIGGSGGNAGEEGDTSTAMERKSVNDAVAYIRSLAELRGRNVEWAEAAVRGAESLPADEALAAGVIDLVAADEAALLTGIDGRVVSTQAGDVTLNTAGLVLERHEPGWRTSLLAVITNPLVAYGLLIIGLYGLLFEGYNPGAIVPGVVGAICLLIGLYALQVLSVNYAGLALIVLGLLMMIAEFFVPSFGALGLGGLAAFVFGSVMLMESGGPVLGVSTLLLASMATAAGLLMLGTVYLAHRARKRPIASGAEQMVGATGVAAEAFEGEGRIRLYGEDWAATSATPVAAGEHVRVKRVQGLILEVEPIDSSGSTVANGR